MHTKKHNTIRETIIRQLIRLRYGCMRTCVCAINMHARTRSACVRMRKVDWEIQCIQQKTTQKRNVVTARKCMRRRVRSSRNCERMRALADDPCSQAMVLKGVRACVRWAVLIANMLSIFNTHLRYTSELAAWQTFHHNRTTGLAQNGGSMCRLPGMRDFRINVQMHLVQHGY